MTSHDAAERLTIVCLLRPNPEQADTLRDALLDLVMHRPAVRALFGDRVQELLAEEMGVHYGAALEPRA